MLPSHAEEGKTPQPEGQAESKLDSALGTTGSVRDTRNNEQELDPDARAQGRPGAAKEGSRGAKLGRKMGGGGRGRTIILLSWVGVGGDNHSHKMGGRRGGCVQSFSSDGALLQS